MVDEQLIRQRWSGDDLETIEHCFQTLNRHKVFELFVHANKQRLVDSFENSEDLALAQQIKDMRQENRVLTALMSLFPPQKEG